MNGKVLLTAAAAAALLTNGCHNKNDTVEGAAPQNGTTQSTPSAAAPAGPSGPAGAAADKTAAGASSSSQPVAVLKVKNALMTSKQKGAWKEITVESSGNTVHLRGTVATAAQKSEAEKIAKQAVGEKSTVQNDLTVKGG